MSVPAPRRLFRAVALAEMVTWALLLGAMALKYGGVTPAAVPIAGGVHGLAFLSYVLVVLALWVDGRWPAGLGVGALASSLVPFLTAPFERWAERRGRLADRWQVLDRPAGERGPLDGLLRTVLRRPALSAGAAALLVLVVFAALLTLGPPTQWGR